MKSITCIGLVWIMNLGICLGDGAATNAATFLFKDGRVWKLQDTEPTPLEEAMELLGNIVVNTNGTFTVGDHSPRAFTEGQILGLDGMLTSPNGRTEPVIDHVALDAGKTLLSLDGEKAAVGGIQLGPDRWLTSDRVLLGGERRWMRVIDGLLFTPDGNTIPAKDTISLQKGRVVVQKEGTLLTIGPGRTMMMNEGTKVFGEGRVLSKDGHLTELTEGQILTIEGVVKLR